MPYLMAGFSKHAQGVPQKYSAQRVANEQKVFCCEQRAELRYQALNDLSEVLLTDGVPKGCRTKARAFQLAEQRPSGER